MRYGPRHIMMTTDAVGGVWVYATTLARRLAQDGMRVTLVTLGPPPRTSKHELARSLPPNVDLIVTDLALEWLDPEGNDTDRAQTELLRIADRVRPDIVHLNGFREGAFPWPCPAIVVAHSCVMSWWQAVHGERSSEARWAIYAEAVAAGLKSVSGWVAPTRAFRRVVRELYRPVAPGWVIPNGLDALPQRAVAKQAIILASGRVWDAGKNLAALARVAPELPWPVHIAGAGVSETANSAGNVHWLGEIERDELQHRMRQAGIYVAPAHYEPFGLGILEAAAAGCALVLSDIESLRELWGGAALQVPPDDAGRLRDALLTVCNDRALRVTLQRAAKSRARRYTLERTARGYMELYDRALAPAARARAATVQEARA